MEQMDKSEERSPRPDVVADATCIVCGTTQQVWIASISDDRYGCPGVYSIARCPTCGQMATLPALSEADLPALYSRYYPRNEVDFDALQREAARVIAPAAALRRWLAGTDNQGHYRARAGQQVLDIGSGPCLSLLELRAMGVEAWGVEADPNVRVIADRFGLQVHIGSIHDHPFPGQSFDLIVLNQVIEHVPNPQALLETLRERLKPGGRVILSFPNTASLQAAKSGIRWINWHVPYHQHHFNRTSFALLAAHAGYEVSTVRTVTPNLWTLLQLRANRDAPSEGNASVIWNSQPTGQDVRSSFATRLRRAALGRAARLFAVLSALYNRVVDVAGRGDSLLVELRVAGQGGD